MKPSKRGRRYVNSRDGVAIFDGPFVETKELLAGFIIISAESLDAAGRWAKRYIEVVEAEEVDVRELAT
jgi:PhnB protein